MRTIFSPSVSILKALAFENSAEVQRCIESARYPGSVFDVLTADADKVIEHADGLFSFDTRQDGIVVSVSVDHSVLQNDESDVHAYDVAVFVGVEGVGTQFDLEHGIGMHQSVTLIEL